MSELLLGNNQVEEVPAGICHLTDLRTLELRDNRLQTLPQELGG